MKTTLARRTAATIRATLVLVAFTAFAAVGFATAHTLRPAADLAAERATLDTTSARVSHTDLHTAPAGCPLPTAAFRTR